VTPVSIACFNGHADVVGMLIEVGADIKQASTDDGTTPLYMACFKGHIDVVRLLIEAGADINQARTDNGTTPLFMTCFKGHIGVVRLLIEAGADIDQARTDNGVTPFILAAHFGHVEVLSMLIVEGVDTEISASLGANALEAATGVGKLAEYEAAFTESALSAAKLRFGRTLVEETIIPAMAAVNISTNYGEDLGPYASDNLGYLFWREGAAELVFSFLDRHGLIDHE